ncbi:hypothetical protein ERHA54_45470 [Erwinia rhapontici]|uniref:Toxin CdiA n=2 Tax=Erwinia rhapontici TaxID=55212 RepID=A0ABM7N617_ERWRD|nr:hypothetical protein ERHA53_42790 [Erwinia rhapontici]BCQ41944.1 hypothetical protein ERHA54_45470 [Erwinia rhapontici]
MGISSGGSVAGQFVGNMANGLLAGMNGSGSDSSTTKAAVSEGTIVIRDPATQRQDVEGLSRDVEHANQTLSPIFDKEKEQRRLKEAQLIGEIGSQAADIARTQGQIEATRAANDKMKSVTPEQLQAARKAWSKANPGKEPTDKQINEQAYQTFYDKAFAASDFGTGGKVQRAIQAATAAVQGLAGGDLAKAVAGGSAPYIANIIGNSGLDSAGKVLAHAAVNAALAAAQGNSALVGATGAATAELAGIVAVNAYGKPVSELSETEKQTVSALATLAAGLAGGLAGDGTADALAGAQAGKTTVENNSLAGDKARESVKQSTEHWKEQVRDKLGEGTTSSIANGIINALADTGDAALGSADYAADAAMALASCAAGDSYCTKAMSDLEGKNQAAADTLKALMKSETWEAVAGQVKEAAQGNQLALEATGGMLAGLFLPGKKLPDGVASTGKIPALQKNSDGITEVKVSSTPLEGHDRLNTPDVNGNGKYNPAEAAAAARLEGVLGPLERAPDTGGKTADFIISTGHNAGKTVDFMYTTKNLSQKEIDGINKFFEKNMTTPLKTGDIPGGQKQILEHLEKADIVPVDFTVLAPSNQKVFMDYIKTLPKNQQSKIIIMR